tara:strand:- start:480 stop:1478 length:999 start_codon:yes stop_codon:yes gene_type:complete
MPNGYHQHNGKNLLQQAELAVESAIDINDLDQIRVKYLGKKGALTLELKNLSNLPVEERPIVGEQINKCKKKLLDIISSKKIILEKVEIENKIKGSEVDVTLPGRSWGLGTIHPITRTLRRISSIFEQAGYKIETGPEIETEYYNFTALNIGDDHPARNMHDTFYIDAKALLRTHTSPVQIRSLENHGAPIKIVAPGRVYRCDSDLTHTPMFNQIEVLKIDKNINFSNLKSFIFQFLSSFFEREVELRFRPSYFPFTEPSAEVDVLSESGKWLEILGCGMVHPNVLKNVNIDPENYTGFALGLGVERLAMLRYGISDLRLFFENNIDFLKQF